MQIPALPRGGARLVRGFAPALLALLAALPAFAITEVQFPPGAPVINVVTAHGAIANDNLDDTTAFEAAIDAALRTNATNSPSIDSAFGIIYVPNGTYHLSRTLQNRISRNTTTFTWDPNNRWRRGFFLQGESQDGVVLKLINNTFTDPLAPRAVIQIGSEQLNSKDGSGNYVPVLKLSPRITGMTLTSGVVTCTSNHHKLAVGMLVNVTGSPVAERNGIKTIVSVPTAHTFTYTVPSGATVAGPLDTLNYAIRFTPYATGLTQTGGTATLTFPNHGLVPGDQVVISGASDAAYNKGIVVRTTPTANTFTFAVATGANPSPTGNVVVGRFKDGEFNEAFRHYIRNLTVDIGSGNLGAVGIDLVANNRGGLHDVTIRSSDGTDRGLVGLRMDREWPGPAYIRGLTVRGFETGISMLNQNQYGMVLEDVTLYRQRSVGIAVGKNTLIVRDFAFNGTQYDVPAIKLDEPVAGLTSPPNNAGQLVLLDATLIGDAGTLTKSAISCGGRAYLRNVEATSYQKTYDDLTPANSDVTATTVVEQAWPQTYQFFTTDIAGSIKLPVLPTPTYDNITNSFAKWADVTAFGATKDNNADNDAPGIQAAILACAPTTITGGQAKEIVYLPRGAYAVSGPVYIKGPVRKIIGLCAGITRNAGYTGPIFVFQDATNYGPDAATTIVQFVRLDGDLRNDSARQLVLSNMDFKHYTSTATGTGNVFFEDVIGHTVTQSSAQNVWARQLNLEVANYSGSIFSSGGGKVWMLGYKTEPGADSTLFTQPASGWAELLGLFTYPVNTTATYLRPMLINDGGKLSATYKVADNAPKNFSPHVRDIRSGVNNDFVPASLGGNNRNCPLYSGSTMVHP